MKKLLPAIMCLLLSMPRSGRAQTFSVYADTVMFTVSNSSSVFDSIINHTTSGITLKWHVDSTNFPADWLTASALGLCDNNVCYQNDTDNAGNPHKLWNASTHRGDTFTSAVYPPSITNGSYDMALNLGSATTIGTYWLTVTFTQVGALSSPVNATFLITKPMPSRVINNNTSETNISLYPNPAHDEVNVVYDEAADIKTIAIYNIIGKVMNVYKPAASNSANLITEGLPSGIYFVRLSNSLGQVVMTKKFTKQ